MAERFQPTWHSLRRHETPGWLRDAKFGIYTHWGVYSVPACGRNGTWYPYHMYREGTDQYDYHVKTYGPPADFGYKDFIPMFRGERFDPDEWAELFKRAGARFAGPVGEHHDGFTMWDSRLTEWSAARMGPQRDVVGELATAVRKQGMRFLIALHHAENWWFFPHWREDFDTADPQYAGLYGPPHNQSQAPREPDGASPIEVWPLQDKPSKAFLDQWLAKIREVIDNYQPDVLWFDFGLVWMPEHYRREALAYYYNAAQQWGREVAVTYKWHHLVPGVALVDLELGRFGELTYHDWITDTSVDNQGAWAYVQDAGFKSVTALVHNLVDNVSKNGYLLLNVGPKANGEIPEPAQECLLGMGRWLEVNGEAIYDTTPWMTYGEGPTQMERVGMFSERQEVQYTARDIRFTLKDDALYAICLGWPGRQVTIRSVEAIYESEIEAIEMLGVEGELAWQLNAGGLTIETPDYRPCEHAVVFKITRRPPFRLGAGSSMAG